MCHGQCSWGWPEGSGKYSSEARNGQVSAASLVAVGRDRVVVLTPAARSVICCGVGPLVTSDGESVQPANTRILPSARLKMLGCASLWHVRNTPERFVPYNYETVHYEAPVSQRLLEECLSLTAPSDGVPETSYFSAAGLFKHPLGSKLVKMTLLPSAEPPPPPASTQAPLSSLLKRNVLAKPWARVGEWGLLLGTGWSGGTKGRPGEELSEQSLH